MYTSSTKEGGLVDPQPASNEEKGLIVLRKENVKGQTSTNEGKAKSSRLRSVIESTQTTDGDDSGQSQLHETLGKLMSSLDTRRRSSGRPEQVNVRNDMYMYQH